MKKILSTKRVTEQQRELLKDFDLVEDNFIETVLNNSVVIDKQVDCAVFTSQNAVKAVFEGSKIAIEKFSKVFCVGKKTGKLLSDFGLEVLEISNSAYELATYFIEGKNTDKVTFFCGNLRSDDLPELLKENAIEVQEVEVYRTNLIPKKIAGDFDAVMFFSPSAITSYVYGGNSVETTAFCIGHTTAVAAIMEFENVYVAESNSVEAVIESVKENLG